MNDSRLGRFRYPLQSLLRKHEWDVQALALEHASALAALREQEAEQARLLDGLQQTNAALARMRQAGARLDVMQQRLLMDYRVTQEEGAVAQEARLRAALAQCEQIAEQLSRARRSVKSFEKHRENLRDAHEGQARTLSAKEADDAWLMGRRFEEAGS